MTRNRAARPHTPRPPSLAGTDAAGNAGAGGGWSELDAEREQLRAQLERERKRLRQVFSKTPAYIAVVRGPDHVFELTNPHYEQLIGGRDVIGLPAAQALPELAEQGHVALLDHVRRSGEAFVASEARVEYRNAPDGPDEEYFISFVYQPLEGPAGEVDGILAHGVDVSEQVRARTEVERLLADSEDARRTLADVNAALRTSEGRLLATFRNASIGLVMADLDGRVLNANRAFCGFTGYPAYELMGVSLLARVHPQDRAAVGASLETVRSGVVGTHTSEQRIVTRSGVTRWTRSSVSLLRDATGQPVEMVAVVEDIDERVRLGRRRDLLSRADRVLASGQLEVAAMLRAMSNVAVPDVADFCFFDMLLDDGTLQRTAWRHGDPSFAAHYDAVQRMVPPLSMEGHPVANAMRTLQPEFVPDVTDTWMRRAATSDRHLAFMRSLSLRSVVTVPLAVGDRRIGALTFGVTTFSGRSYDAGDLETLVELGRRAAAALENARLFADAQQARAVAEQARAEAEAANRAKSEFLAVMSHELRTPLNAIAGYTQLIEMGIRGPVTERQRSDLARIQSSQRHLLGLINEVLNYARLESGNVDFDIRDVPVRDALLWTAELVAPQAAAKHIEITIGAAPGDLVARADAEKLRQILVNLLSNAIKFTDAGGRVDLDCGTAGDAVSITVRDTGIGIPADRIASIFEPFVQVRSDLTRTAEGAGLGLAISRDLARNMDGELRVQSEDGIGSTFEVVLPRGDAGTIVSATPT